MSPDPFVSYAQNHEDVVLARALHPGKQEGFWIDVGAGGPVIDSVTAAFVERGWRGINVEPLPAEHERLCAARPNDVNLRVALGAEPGIGQLFEGPAENRGSSTMVEEIAERYADAGQKFARIEVRVTTLAAVAAEHAPDVVDFLKIDVEGYEHAVLEGVEWSDLRPRIIVIEATVPNTTQANHEQWEPMLLEQGYRFAMFDGLNRFYASVDEPELAEALSVPANVLDNFVPYVWAEQVRGASETAHEAAAAARDAERRARHHFDRAALTFEEVTTLRTDLDTAQRLTAQALGDLESEQRKTAQAQAEVEKAQTEIEALVHTRLYRYTSPARKAYGALRRRVRRGPAAAR